MRKTIRAVLGAASVAATFFLSSAAVRAAAPATPQGFITQRVFFDLGGGTTLDGLTNSAKFPNAPDSVTYPQYLELWANPAPGGETNRPAEDFFESYGAQIIGYFYPTVTGPHTFYISADDNAALFLSTDDTPANKHLIAMETGWSSTRQYTNSAGGNTAAVLNAKRSDRYPGSTWPTGTNINLVAGQPYYIEAIFKEGGGGDNLSVSIGDINAANQMTPIRGTQLSSIDRANATSPFLIGMTGNGGGILFQIQELAGGSQVNFSSVQVTLNGNPVTPTTQRIADNSGANKVMVAYLVPAPYLAIGSTNVVNLTFTDTGSPPLTQNATRQLVVGPYTTIPAGYAVSSASGQGFHVEVYQIPVTRLPDENSTATAEQQWARGFLTNGVPFPNTAPLGDTFDRNNVVNRNVNPGVDYDLDRNPNAADAGNWRHVTPPLPAPYDVEDQYFPGIGFTAGDPAYANNIVLQTTAYLQLAPGFYRMGVNSDDGFKVTTAPGVRNPFGLVLGSFGDPGGRGAANSFMDFVVTTGGLYPFRLLYWQGGGAGSLEWFTVNLLTGQNVLINDPSDPSALIPYQTAQGRAYVDSVLPADGYTGGATNQTVKAVLKDDLTSVVNGSIQLWQDGVQVTPTITQNAGTSTVSYQKPGGFSYSSKHTNTLIWSESTTPQTTWTNTFTFQTRQFGPDDLLSYTAGTFWIEAEDFDATGTPVPTNVNVMPYNLGAAAGTQPGPYAGIGAMLNVDYFNNDNRDNGTPTTYRSTGDPNVLGRSVDVARDDGPVGDMRRRRPVGFDMTANYKIGWGDSADWYNYTRKIPAGLYTALVSLSNGGVAAGTPDRMGATLSIVTSGVGTTNQTLKNVGTFNGPSSGGWSVNNLVPMYAPDGSKAAFKITSATTTLRFSLREGDFDWFVLMPVSGVAPKVTIASPLANTASPVASPVPRDAKVRLTLEDFSTAVVVNSVKLFFNGADVTTSAVINKTADITTVTYDPGPLAAGSTNNYELRFTDNGAPAVTQTNKATFTVSVAMGTPGQFLIEAEDFNYGGGQSQAAANATGYAGGAYANLGAVLGVDYNDNDGTDSYPYRPPLTNNFDSTGTNRASVNHDQQLDAGTLDVVRADGWTMTANYKLGWVGGGNWYNYTRTFPANTYAVFAALSHDPSDGLRGSLSQVTSNPAQPNQTVVPLGTFNAPTSGGWGDNNLVQMKNSGGRPAVIPLGGVQTVRFNGDSGDYDYLLFVPAPLPLEITSVTTSGANLTLNWTIPSGSPTPMLQQASALTGSPGDWSDVGPAPGNSITVTVGPGNKFYRLKQ